MGNAAYERIEGLEVEKDGWCGGGTTGSSIDLGQKDGYESFEADTVVVKRNEEKENSAVLPEHLHVCLDGQKTDGMTAADVSEFKRGPSLGCTYLVVRSLEECAWFA